MHIFLYDVTTAELVKFETLPDNFLRRVDAIDVSDDYDFNPDAIHWDMELLERYFEDKLIEIAR